MLSEDFDKKIKEAADHHHPPYKEEGWKNMNRLLDKHLPQKEKERRRFILFFLVFIALLAGSVAILVPKARQQYQAGTITTEQTSHTTTTPTTITPSDPANASQHTRAETNEAPKVNDVKAKNDAVRPYPSPLTSQPETKNPVAVSEQDREAPGRSTENGQTISSPSTHEKIVKKKKSNSNAQPVQAQTSTRTRSSSPVLSTASREQKEKETMPVMNAEPKAGDAEVIPMTEIKPADVVTPAPVETKAEQHIPESQMEKTPAKESGDSVAQQSTEAPVVSRKGKPSFGSKWALVLSAGPDLSFTSGRAGQLETVKGIGIGYTINDRFSVRTGFYTARKIYTADAKDYTFSGNVGAYYPNLKSVDGDCIVYEIPLLVNYRFAGKGASSWYVSTGISSLLMHREEYNYYYKPWASGNMMQKKWAVSDKNKHYFSLLAFSAGYIRRLNDRFFIQAEPYLRLPLHGVGEGKVDLKGAGVLFSVGFQPWK